jgi:hypothetical protein
MHSALVRRGWRVAHGLAKGPEAIRGNASQEEIPGSEQLRCAVQTSPT